MQKEIMGALSAVATGGMTALSLAAAHAAPEIIGIAFVVTTCKALSDVWADSPNPAYKQAAVDAAMVAANSQANATVAQNALQTAPSTIQPVAVPSNPPSGLN